MALDSVASLQNDRAPLCHSERSEESGSAGAYTSSLEVAGGGNDGGTTYSLCVSFSSGCEMAAVFEHCLGLFVAVLLRMTAVPVPN